MTLPHCLNYEVIARDIDFGVAKHCRRCPIAHAVRRAFLALLGKDALPLMNHDADLVVNVRSGQISAGVHDPEFPGQPLADYTKINIARMSSNATVFMYDFDRAQKVFPFSCSLTFSYPIVDRYFGRC